MRITVVASSTNTTVEYVLAGLSVEKRGLGLEERGVKEGYRGRTNNACNLYNTLNNVYIQAVHVFRPCALETAQVLMSLESWFLQKSPFWENFMAQRQNLQFVETNDVSVTLAKAEGEKLQQVCLRRKSNFSCWVTALRYVT